MIRLKTASKLKFISNIKWYIVASIPALFPIGFGCDTPPKGQRACNQLIGETANDTVYFNLCKTLNAYFSYDEALKEAQKNNKKILILFNSVACVNCRDFENTVLFSPKITDFVNNNFITAVLFVDETKTLELKKKYVSTLTKRQIKTTGQYNTEIQLLKTQHGSQPFISVSNAIGDILCSYDGKLDSTVDFEIWLRKTIIDCQ